MNSEFNLKNRNKYPSKFVDGKKTECNIFNDAANAFNDHFLTSKLDNYIFMRKKTLEYWSHSLTYKLTKHPFRETVVKS